MRRLGVRAPSADSTRSKARDAMSGLHQIEHHRAAHVAEADETNRSPSTISTDQPTTSRPGCDEVFERRTSWGSSCTVRYRHAGLLSLSMISARTPSAKSGLLRALRCDDQLDPEDVCERHRRDTARAVRERCRWTSGSRKPSVASPLSSHAPRPDNSRTATTAVSCSVAGRRESRPQAAPGAAPARPSSICGRPHSAMHASMTSLSLRIRSTPRLTNRRPAATTPMRGSNAWRAR